MPKGFFSEKIVPLANSNSKENAFTFPTSIENLMLMFERVHKPPLKTSKR